AAGPRGEGPAQLVVPHIAAGDHPLVGHRQGRGAARESAHPARIRAAPNRLIAVTCMSSTASSLTIAIAKVPQPTALELAELRPPAPAPKFLGAVLSPSTIPAVSASVKPMMVRLVKGSHISAVACAAPGPAAVVVLNPSAKVEKPQA